MPSLVTRGAPLVPLLFLIAFFLLSVGIGRRILRLFGASQGVSPAEYTIISLALGAGSLQLVPLVLGAVGLLTTRSIQIAVGIIAVGVAVDLAPVAMQVIRDFRLPRPKLWQAAWLLALAPPVVLAFLFALAPTVDADGLGYHLTVPKRWLASGWLEYLPTYSYSNTPMGVEMLFSIALAFAGDSGAKCVHFLLGLAGAVGLYLAGKRLHGPVVGAIAATLFLVGIFPVVELLGLAYIEGAVAFAMIASVLAWLVWFQIGDRSWLSCAAVLAGVAVSFKMTAAVFPIMMVAMTVVAVVLDQPHPAQTLPRLALRPRDCALLLLMAVPVLPWLLRSVLVTGNPFYPMFAGFIPSRDLSPGAAAAFEQHFRYWNWGTSLGASWTLEWRKLLLGAAAGVAVMAGIGAFMVLRSRQARGVAVVLVATSLLQLLAVGLYQRFWIAIASVLALPIIALFGSYVSRPLIRSALIVMTAIASGAQTAQLSAGVDMGGLVRVATGTGDRRDYLVRVLPLLPIYELANRESPQSARILLVSACIGFYLERPTFCGETIQESIRWTTWEECVTDLRRLGVTHVITPQMFATGDAPRTVARTSLISLHYHAQVEILNRLLNEHARLLTTVADQGLYALEPSIGAAR